MSKGIVCREYVQQHPGVYFFIYSVPEVIVRDIRLITGLGPGAKIYHHSIVHSDGNGKIETITAGPDNASAWYKQAGLTSIQAQIAFLAHPEKRRITENFDSIPWSHPNIKKIFIKTNWSKIHFEFAKSYVSSSLDKISSVRYNIAGHNSNSFVTLLWTRLSSNLGEREEFFLDDPNILLSRYFRPGSKFTIFDRTYLYYFDLIKNWLSIAKNVGLLFCYIGAGRAHQLMAARRGSRHSSQTKL